MNNFLNIGQAIVSQLSSLEGIKIYPLVVKEGTNYPFMVYKRNSLTSGYSKDGLHQIDASINIEVVTDKYSEGISIANKVIDLIKGASLEGYSLEVKLENASENFLSDAYIQALTFSITIN